ncbi:unnamed protein product [Plutella xylostella]|uniref:(diamondback moth) hypothetical protein n=1 Tax=Plutella xylostella TaxID=51655 RepID=A0A8S4DSE2_PLUXY|nr:unnamed protein product [Plutella xylostella]
MSLPSVPNPSEEGISSPPPNKRRKVPITAPLVLEGETLGKRHKNFNKFVNDAIKSKLSFECIKTLEEKSDVDRLFKIDVASSSRNVEYILETLQCEDMLYVSRAIKKSTWLVTEQQYAHIVNPQYLNETLFPLMMAKAASKFLLFIRLNLKEEARAQEFYNYYKSTALESAVKWLPKCSPDFIDKAVENYCNVLEIDLFKRLCERSINVLVLFVKKHHNYYKKNEYIKSVMYLMNTNTEQYLDIVETGDEYSRRMPKFGPKYTEIIMKKCPQRIIQNFEMYATSIHVPTFVKYYGKEKIKEFLLEQFKNDKMKNGSWFRYENIKEYIKLMPKEGKFEFLKKVFIDKKENDDETGGSLVVVADAMRNIYVPCSPTVAMAYKSALFANASSKSVYQWYVHAPFNVALPELKKLIRTESLPNERLAIMAVLLRCAGENMKHIQTVLQYYHDRHINEPFKFKVQFVNQVLSATDAHRYDAQCWRLLDELIHSMDVYVESENIVQECIQAIILYKILRKQQIPDIIETKFEFTTFKKRIGKLNDEEKEDLFKYLYNFIEKKINKQDMNDHDGFSGTVTHISELIDLLVDWKKSLPEYPLLLNKIKALIKLEKEQTKRGYSLVTLTNIFSEKKTLRRHLFEESLLLSPTEEACINALKHDPELLKRYATVVNALRYDDNITMTRILRKLKVYFSDSLANEWAAAYRNKLTEANPVGHKTVTRGLCMLLPQDDFISLVKSYAPENLKIKWSETDKQRLSVQKNIAMTMHIARPQISPDVVLLYAKGDFLQYALPSLNAVFYNISSARSRDHIPKLIQAPVSIQKHGLRLAFSKLKLNEIRELFSNIWKSTKNASIRCVIFVLTHKLLSKEKSEAKIEGLWQLLEVFIDNLSEDENKNIYNLLGDLDNVPDVIKARYCIKSYKFLKSLPGKADFGELMKALEESTFDLMDTIDPDFVKGILLENIDEVLGKNKLYTKYTDLQKVISAYLTCAKTEEIQMERFNTILVPIMNHGLRRWTEIHNKHFTVRNYVLAILKAISYKVQGNGLKKGIIIPVKLFYNIYLKLKEHLPVAENYVLLSKWEMSVHFLECFSSVRPLFEVSSCDKPADEGDVTYTSRQRVSCDTNAQWDRIGDLCVSEFGKRCLDKLKAEVVARFPSIYTPFSVALSNVLEEMGASTMFSLSVFNILLSDTSFVPGYLAVIQLLPKHRPYYGEKEDQDIQEKRKGITRMIASSNLEEVKIHYYQEYSEYAEVEC